MRGKTLRSRVAQGLATVLVVGGFVAIASQVAYANGPFLVKVNGVSSGTCSTWATACTLSYALGQEGTAATPPGPIWMKHGVYAAAGNSVINAAGGLTTANNGVVISGGYKGLPSSSSAATLVAAATVLKPHTLGTGQKAIIDFSGSTNVTVERLTVNSGAVAPKLPLYASGHAPVVNSGGSGDALGTLSGVGVTVTKGTAPALHAQPTDAILLTGGSTTLTSVTVTTQAYHAAGVLCSGLTTTCTVAGGTVVGDGATVNGPGEVGISTTDDATATLTGVSVTGDVNPGVGMVADPLATQGIGILSGPDATNNLPTNVSIGAGTSTAGDNLGIEVAGVLSAGVNASTTTIVGTNASGDDACVLLLHDTAGVLPGNATVTMTDDTLGGSASGVGLDVDGTSNQVLGALGPSNTNIVTGNGSGVSVQASGSTSSATNTLMNFDVHDNIAFGVDIVGPNTPREFFSGNFPPIDSAGTIVEDSTFANNGTTSVAAGANVVSFDGYGGPAPIGSGLVTTTDIPPGSGVGSVLTLKNTSGTAISIADGQPLMLPNLGATIFVDNGVGITHILASGSSFTFSVNFIVPVLDLASADIPVGTAVSNAPFAAAPDDIGTLSGNTVGTGTPVAGCNNTTSPVTYGIDFPGVPLTSATTVNGGFYDC